MVKYKCVERLTKRAVCVKYGPLDIFATEEMRALSVISSPGHIHLQRLMVCNYVSTPHCSPLRSKYLIVTEWVPGSCIMKRVRSYALLLRMLSHMTLALTHLHSLGIVHCDVKPHNIFGGKSGDVYVLGDFNASLVTHTTIRFGIQPGFIPHRSRPFLGTRYFSAPEVKRAYDLSSELTVTKALDYYSLGKSARYLQRHHCMSTRPYCLAANDVEMLTVTAFIKAATQRHPDQRTLIKLDPPIINKHIAKHQHS